MSGHFLSLTLTVIVTIVVLEASAKVEVIIFRFLDYHTMYKLKPINISLENHTYSTPFMNRLFQQHVNPKNKMELQSNG